MRTGTVHFIENAVSLCPVSAVCVVIGQEGPATALSKVMLVDDVWNTARQRADDVR